MRSRPRLAVAVVLTALIGALLTVVPATGPQGEASAADAADFNAGLLISDGQFYDGDAMTAGEVQAFIERMNAGCDAGFTCLDAYRQSTSAIAADAYCDALPATTNESAASIIARVGVACDISQKFLLVLLQKEQSLVTLTNPYPIRYERATGFACPDSSPCNSEFGGFYYQVYFAARQYNRYAAHPDNYNHQAGEWNNVLYHPNAACGRGAVYIQNLATAGLYNYTPYQPNAAALANLYGEGDSCSAYGNRNAWRIWTDWFGDPTLESPVDALPTADRLAGANRYATSVEISRRAFSSGAPVVYLASGENFPDGLAAGPAAAHQGGPVLLTQQSTLTPVVADEIRRLRPAQVVIVGDTPSVSARVETQVRALMQSAAQSALPAQEAEAEAQTTEPAAQPELQPTAPTAEAAPLPTAPDAAPQPAAPDAEPQPTAPAAEPDAEPQHTEPAAEAEPQPTEPAHEAEAAPQSTQPAPDVAAADEAQAVDAARTDPVLRLGGANRYETSRLIALHAFDSAASAFVATGVRFPDALAAGPAAAHRNGPVLLVDGERGALDSATRATLAELGVGWVGIAGDTASVSAGVATGLDAAVTTVRRYAGTNRYATAAQLSTVFGAADVAYVASGQNFPDALSGAAAAGAQGAPMLLARHSCMPDDTSDALLGFMPNEVLVLGGTPTLSPDAARYTSCD